MADLDEESPNAKIHQNQPYDESLEVPDSEEVASIYTPSPRVPLPGDKTSVFNRGRSRGNTPPDSRMDDQNSDDEFDAGPNAQPGQVGYDDQTQSEGDTTPQVNPQQQLKQQQAPTSMTGQSFDGDEDEDEESSEGDDDDDDEDDDDDNNTQLEGAYDPADYEHLSVSPDIKDLFQYISRYTPQSIELDHKLKPFIPDFIPAVGDIDAFIKVTRPDGKPDTIGLQVLDEPCAKQSDPTVLDLQLRAISKQTNLKAMVVRSVENAEKNPKAVDNWIESIRELHRSRPPPNVHYTKNMPEIDDLMQEWPHDFEELLKEVGLPSAELDCDLGAYVDMICAILDIPIYKSRVQSLHVLFTLYSEFKNSQHFKALADENQMDNQLKDDAADTLVL